jgi:hypothetical protein
MKDFFWPIVIVFAIIAIVLFGGAKNYQSGNTATSTMVASQSSGSTQTEISQNNQNDIEQNVQSAQEQTTQIAQEVAAANTSRYAGQINMMWGNYGSTNPSEEYLEIDANPSNPMPIDITGWTITSTSTGIVMTIPQSTVLYFANSQNSVQDIVLSPGDRAYIVTGRSPINSGFRTNICSGYLSQFNTFTPGLYTSCPAPHNEDLSSIPNTVNNDNCFQLINNLSSCQTYTQPLDHTYSYECQQFVETKLNYQSCVDTHKNDANFYSPQTWYVYLNQSTTIWQPQYETAILKDTSGKQVVKIMR